MLLKEFELQFEKVDTANNTTAIIVAAGTASRMNGIDKQLANLLGVPVIVHTIKAFQNSNLINNIIVVTRQDLVLTIQNLVSEYNLNKVTDIVVGGNNRAQSVINGLTNSKDADVVLIHDGARPLVTNDIIENTVNTAKMYGAAVCAVPVKDTIKIVDANGLVQNTPNRASLMAVQTPQCFKTTVLSSAISQNTQNLDTITDDSTFVEMANGNVYTVMGSYDNIKITTKEDLVVAENILKLREGE